MKSSLERDLRVVAKKFQKKLKKIKVVLFDIDGILTDALVRYEGEEVGFNRSFHAQDGYGIKVLMQAGIKVGVISGGVSLSIHKRFIENLQVDFTFFGSEDKREAFLEVMRLTGVKAEEILFMGDELFDIPLMKRAGFSATVPFTSAEVKEAADYVTQRRAGLGAAREVMDLVRHAQNITPEILDFD